jgi:hypothetical protein
MIPTNREQTPEEIRKIRQELENLERAYAGIEYAMRFVPTATYVFIAALMIFVIWRVADDLNSAAILLLAFVMIFLASVKFEISRLVTWWVWMRVPGTEIEKQIADRKARLAALHQDQ